MKTQPKTVLITGANSGIGEALSFCYASKECNLFLCGRNTKELSNVAQKCKNINPHIKVEATQLNYLEQKESVATIKKLAPNVDVAILCAGVSQRGITLNTEYEVVEKIFTVNTLTPILLFNEFAKSWSSATHKKKKQLVIISSVASHIAVPLRSSYSASKKATEMYVQSFINEIRSPVYQKQFVNADGINTTPKVDITVVLPGFVNTNISNKALTKDGTQWKKLDNKQARGASVEKVATKIYKALSQKKPPRRMYVGMNISLYVLVFLSKYFPKLTNLILSKIKVT